MNCGIVSCPFYLLMRKMKEDNKKKVFNFFVFNRRGPIRLELLWSTQRGPYSTRWSFTP
jgi:hypothetical protein